jgi:hypothetical protein
MAVIAYPAFALHLRPRWHCITFPARLVNAVKVIRKALIKAILYSFIWHRGRDNLSF